MIQQAIVLNIEDEIIVLPLQENLDEAGVDTFEELKDKWESVKWGYYNTAEVTLIDVGTAQDAEDVKKQLKLFPDMPATELTVIENYDDTLKCEELDVWAFKENMIKVDLYHTPFDVNPDETYFSSYYAWDCYRGRVYSKDFAWFECEECNRDICEQNPANGWRGQYKELGDSGERICVKCWQENALENGVGLDEAIEEQKIDGDFFNYSEVEAAGWVKHYDSILVGSGRTGHGSEKYFFDKLKELKKEKPDTLVLFDFDSMAIGGMGAYVNVYIKDKKAADEK